MRLHHVLTFYRDICARIGIPAGGADTLSSPETVAPHPLLRRTLQCDPAMEAILRASSARFAFGCFDGSPFRLPEPELIQLSSALAHDSSALSAAARWGLEAHRLRSTSRADTRGLVTLAHYGRALVQQLAPASRARFLATVPPSVRPELDASACPADSSGELLAWCAQLANGEVAAGPRTDHEIDELAHPLEGILTAGGDSRLAIISNTGCNRYGIPPRPRPEAIHFSSSTASAISDYGFLLCELLRRDLLSAAEDAAPPAPDLKSRLANVVGTEILDLLGLDRTVGALAIAPSGTDAELLAVLVAHAGAPGSRLVNVLIAPDESGSGVSLAAKGCYFDDVTAAGADVVRGAPVWPGTHIDVKEVPIRDRHGNPLPASEIDRHFLAVARAALKEGDRLLAHVLMSSKTDLCAPSLDAVAELVAEAPDRVDVVVDACQLRVEFAALGDIVRRGWMVQLTGSKFLTGPPFSGALAMPACFESRAAAIVDGLRRSCAISPSVAWCSHWIPGEDGFAKPASYGPLFRWLPALLEARLLLRVPKDFRCEIAARFRDALIERIAASRYLRPLKVGERARSSSVITLENSILSFAVLGRRGTMELTPLSQAECRMLFELLNRDVASMLQPLAPEEEALARQPVHIGQPVTLGSGENAMTVLRLVLGARFFTAIGHSDPMSRTAVLESEIADAQRAIAKIELLASYWSRLG